MRWIRFIASLALGIYAIKHHELLAGLMAGVLFIQAYTNVSCCGFGSCESNTKNIKKSENDFVEFEEIK